MYINSFGDVYEEVVYLKPSYSFLTTVPEKPFTRSARQRHNEINLTNNNTQGKKSQKACQRIRLTLGYMLLAAKKKWIYNEKGQKDKEYRLTMATFTLPSKQVHSDNEIKKECLNQLLIELHRYHNVYNYIWLAEPMMNGNIHFHCVFDKYIEKNSLNKRWNRIINKLGYVNEFAKKFKHDNPPSVRIEAIKNVKKIEAYFSGEFTADKSKDYNEYTDRNTKEVKHHFNNCNPYAVIGHERAVLPVNDDYDRQEREFAEFEARKALQITPSHELPTVYSMLCLPCYDGDDNPISRQDYEMEVKKYNELPEIKKDSRFYIERRPIEGRIWFAGGPAAREKGIKLVLNDDMSKKLNAYVKDKKEKTIEMKRVDKLTGLNVSFGLLLLISLEQFLNCKTAEFSNPVKELIKRIQSPVTDKNDIKNKPPPKKIAA